MEVGARLREALRGRYTIERVLGRGGMATVFLAHDHKHGRQVALKVLRPELSAALGAERFLREIQIEARLQHPHILPLYDSGQADGLLYFVMPFIEGESLRQRLDREQQLPVEDAVRIAADVAEALSYAHSHGVVHRDVKPENILLTGGHAVVADFGIARALTVAGGGDEITGSGIAVGTPAYMSPEQGNAGGADPRGDIYSLGCVLYEMLAGEPPFTGRTAQAIIARHVSEPPPSLRIIRPSISIDVERTVARALAKVPADRYSTATQFSEALATAVTGDVDKHQRIVRPTTVAVSSVLTAVLLVTVFSQLLPGGSLNSSQYLIGTMDAQVMTDMTSRQRWVIALEAALQQVPDVILTDSPRVIDRVQQRGGEPNSLDGWLDFAKGLGAGRMVLVAFDDRGPDSLLVRASIYDVRRGRSTTVADRMVPRHDPDIRAQAARVIEHLLDLPDSSLTTHPSSYEAQQAFVAGRIALQRWDLEQADAFFSKAVDDDHGLAPAHFWLSQVRAWRGDSTDRWIGSARLALAHAEMLGGHEIQLARALVNMGEGKYPQACEVYDSLLAERPADFQAWFGLGECHRMDRIVVRDNRSPSRWRFRSSYHRAAEAYRRAFEVVPSFMFTFRDQAYERAAEVLVAETGFLRIGRGEPPDTGLFAAYPSLDPRTDTLEFVPFPASLVFNADAAAIPPRLTAAVRRGRDLLIRVTTGWAGAFPDSAKPLVAMSRALEAVGTLDGSGRGPTALAGARMARAASRTRADSVRAGASQVRLLVKLGRFDAARALADTLLRDTDGAEPLELAGVAALTGRVHLAATLNAQGVDEAFDDEVGVYRDVAVSLLEASQRFATYASFGAPTESLVTLWQQVEMGLAAHGRTEFSDLVSCRLLWYPIGLAFNQLRTVTASPCEGNDLLRMQRSLVDGDTNIVVALVNRVVGERRGDLPGDVAPDLTLSEARVLLAIGDSARAVSHLDRSLNALQAMRMDLLMPLWHAAGLVQAMELRAQLAASGNDLGTARRWARAVVALWGDADLEDLQQRVLRLRSIAGDG